MFVRTARDNAHPNYIHPLRENHTHRERERVHPNRPLFANIKHVNDGRGNDCTGNDAVILALSVQLLLAKDVAVVLIMHGVRYCEATFSVRTLTTPRQFRKWH